MVGNFSVGIILSCANLYAALITTFLLILEDCITTIYFYKYKHIKHIQSYLYIYINLLLNLL